MSFKVTVEPSKHSFQVENGESILDAAIRNGLSFQYACRNGVCGVCKGKVVEGDVSYPNEFPVALSDTEEAVGQALFCCAHADSDLVLEVHEITNSTEIPIRKLPTRVVKMERLASDVMQIFLKIPDSQRLQFLAGQYIDIMLSDERRRSFSIANAPHNDETLELHIRKIEGGEFTSHVFDGMQEKDIVRIEGPYGRFSLNEESDKPIIFVAGGTGFGPTKGIVEHAFQEGVTRPMYLYWGARNREGLYMTGLAEEWAGQKGLNFVPVLSEPLDSDQWQGRTGFVHQAVLDDFPDLSGYEVYACGPPAMISEARSEFTLKGMDKESFHFDSFDFAGS